MHIIKVSQAAVQDDAAFHQEKEMDGKMILRLFLVILLGGFSLCPVLAFAQSGDSSLPDTHRQKLEVPLTGVEQALAGWRSDVVVPKLWQPQDQDVKLAELREKMAQSLGNQADKSLETDPTPKLDLNQFGQTLAQTQGSQQPEPQGWQRQGEKLSLTLQQSLELALQHNLPLLIATLSRDAVQFEVPRAKAQFHPTVGFAFTASGERQLPEQKPTVHKNTQDVTAFLSQLVPTGATLVLSSDFHRQEIQGDTPPRAIDAAVTLSLIQPLLRGGGLAVTTRPIKDAEFGLRIEEARLKAALLTVVLATKSAYYNVVLTEKITEVTEQAVARDKALIEASQALFNAGLATKRDTISAELVLSKDAAKLAKAQANFALAINTLLDTLGVPIATEVALLDKDLGVQPLPLEQVDQWVITATTNRPEIAEIEELLGQGALHIRVARNIALPQLDLVASYGKAQSGSTFGRAFDFRGEIWSAGLVFSIPLGNVAARSALSRAEVEQARLQQQLVQQKRVIELEVRKAVIKLHQSVETIRTLRVGVEQAEGKLEIAKARFALGLATNFDITNAQDDLLSAQTDLLTAIADYNTGLAELEASIAGPIAIPAETPRSGGGGSGEGSKIARARLG